MSGVRFGGVVLCGGQSRRMGRSKALLPFGNEVMLTRTVRTMGEAVGPMVVVAAPDQELPTLGEGVIVARDEVEGEGPLRGISAGLRALDGQADAAFVSSCDVPFLSGAFVRCLLESLGDHDVAVAVAEGRHHPLAAVYRMNVLAKVDALLAAERRRPFFLFEQVDCVEVAEPALRKADPDLKSLWNMNTSEDYEAALREAGLG
jgi:molybdopterin-guanine dinucleotide biosynthesis protein A